MPDSISISRRLTYHAALTTLIALLSLLAATTSMAQTPPNVDFRPYAPPGLAYYTDNANYQLTLSVCSLHPVSSAPMVTLNDYSYFDGYAGGPLPNCGVAATSWRVDLVLVPGMNTLDILVCDDESNCTTVITQVVYETMLLAALRNHRSVVANSVADSRTTLPSGRQPEATGEFDLISSYFNRSGLAKGGRARTQLNGFNETDLKIGYADVVRKSGPTNSSANSCSAADQSGSYSIGGDRLQV